MKVILGIDPGLTLGFGIVKTDGSRMTALAYGAIRTTHDRTKSFRIDLNGRLEDLTRRMEEVIQTHSPDEVAMEEFRFYRQNVSSTIKLGNVLGVLKGLFHAKKLPFREFSAQEIKRAVTGYPNAGKGQVQRMVRLLLGLEDVPRPQHAADALAAAIALVHRAEIPAEAQT